VSDATTVSDPNSVYKGRQVNLVYPTSGSMTLAYDTTYYWRVDEVNDPNQTTNVNSIDVQQLNLGYITYATWPVQWMISGFTTML